MCIYTSDATVCHWWGICKACHHDCTWHAGKIGVDWILKMPTSCPVSLYHWPKIGAFVKFRFWILYCFSTTIFGFQLLNSPWYAYYTNFSFFTLFRPYFYWIFNSIGLFSRFNSFQSSSISFWIWRFRFLEHRKSILLRHLSIGLR